MKTAISIRDDIFEEAEETAQQLGLSRSRLYTLAILEYVQNHASESITSRLNDIHDAEKTDLDDDIKQLNYDLLTGDDW